MPKVTPLPGHGPDTTNYRVCPVCGFLIDPESAASLRVDFGCPRCHIPKIAEFGLMKIQFHTEDDDDDEEEP